MGNSKRMTQLTPDVLEKLWATQTEILDEVVRICDKYNLSYFLNYGTLIGAVRHKGFIPWDDDLDIGMARDDYERFIQIAKTELNEKFYLQNADTESKYWLPFAKIRKNNTLFEEPYSKGMSDKIHKGIFIDIFPLDYVKKNRGWFVHIQFILSKAINETMYYKAGIYKSDAGLHYKRLDKLLAKLPLSTLCKIQKEVVCLQGTKKTKYLADFTATRSYLQAIYPTNYFLPVQDMEFAGGVYKVPNEYDIYLRSLYGDYMQMPKEEDRVNHRTLDIVFDTTKEK